MRRIKRNTNEIKGRPVFERYLVNLKLEVDDKTIKKHRTYLGQSLMFINKDPYEINLEDVEQLREEVTFNCNYEDDTRYQFLSITRNFLRFIGFKDHKKIKMPKKQRHVPPEKEIWLLPDEEKAIIKKSKEINVRAYAIVKLLLSSGIRAGELIRLDILDINWDDQTIHVRHGKGDKSRYACFDSETKKAIEDYLINRIEPTEDKNALFTTQQQKRISYEIVNNTVKECAIQAGITKNITPHKLRHTFVTKVIETTKDLPLAQKLAGHTEIKTTMRYHHTMHETIVQKYKEQLDNPNFSKDEDIKITDQDILRKLDIKYLQGEIPQELYFKLREEYGQGSNLNRKNKSKGEDTDLAYR